MGRRHGRSLALLFAPVVLLVAACASSSTTGSVAPARPLVLASTPLVGMLVRSIAGDQADVRVLLPSGASPDTAPADAAVAGIEGADLLVVVDDATYETGLDLGSTEAPWSTIPVLRLAPQLNPVPLGGSELDPGTATAATATATDPHVWLDPDRWTQAARLVAEELEGLDGTDAATLQANVAAFDELSSRTDEALQVIFATVSDDERTLVTDLPGLAYVADRYGFELVVADGPAALAAAAAERGAAVVFVAASRRDAVAAELAASNPSLEVVGLDLDGTVPLADPSSDGGTPPQTSGRGADDTSAVGYGELLLAVANSIATALGA